MKSVVKSDVMVIIIVNKRWLKTCSMQTR